MSIEHPFSDIVCLTFDDLYNSYLTSSKQHLDDPFFEQHYIARQEHLPSTITFDMYLKMYSIHDTLARASMFGYMVAGEHVERLVDTVIAPDTYPLFLEYIEASDKFYTVQSYSGIRT